MKCDICEGIKEHSSHVVINEIDDNEHIVTYIEDDCIVTEYHELDDWSGEGKEWEETYEESIDLDPVVKLMRIYLGCNESKGAKKSNHMFKAKRKDNGKWVKGYLVENEIYVPIKNSNLNSLDSQYEIYEIIPETIKQC